MILSYWKDNNAAELKSNELSKTKMIIAEMNAPGVSAVSVNKGKEDNKLYPIIWLHITLLQSGKDKKDCLVI